MMNYARYLFGASTVALATLAFDVSAFGQASQLPPVVVEQAKPTTCSAYATLSDGAVDRATQRDEGR